MLTAQEHFDWSMKRAEDYLNIHQPREALQSFFSDMKKHEECATRLIPALMFMGLMFESQTVEQARRFLKGFPRP